MKKGWAKARIGRYLGVSRSRVGQRVEKYQAYAATGKYPQIEKALSKASGNSQVDPGSIVSFSREDWEDREFVVQLLNQVIDS